MRGWYKIRAGEQGVAGEGRISRVWCGDCDRQGLRNRAGQRKDAKQNMV